METEVDIDMPIPSKPIDYDVSNINDFRDLPFEELKNKDGTIVEKVLKDESGRVIRRFLPTEWINPRLNSNYERVGISAIIDYNPETGLMVKESLYGCSDGEDGHYLRAITDYTSRKTKSGRDVINKSKDTKFELFWINGSSVCMPSEVIEYGIDDLNFVYEKTRLKYRTDGTKMIVDSIMEYTPDGQGHLRYKYCE